MITFIIPVYNAQATLKRTLESVLGQTKEDYEILVVNDGSTDGTEELCQRYLSQYPDKITYLYQENRGLGGARNRGLLHARGEYVSFLDSDDYLMPEYVERIACRLAGLAPKDRPEIIMTLPRIYHEESKRVEDWYDKELFYRIFPEDGTVVSPMERRELYQLEVNQCRKVVRLDFLQGLGFQFRERIKWEDVFPHFWLLTECRKCMGIGSVGFYYRIGSSTQITGLRGRERLDILEVFEELTAYAAQKNKDDLTFPIMRVLLRFSIWCIRMADMETRKELVDRLHVFFKHLPGGYYRSLKKEGKRQLPKADVAQYRLFAAAIRYRPACRLFYDYLYQETGERVIKKLLGAGERVA